MVATGLVSMRRPELALHFPDEVRQFAARCHSRQQRLIPAINLVPVGAGHVRHPELVALQPPDFAQHLPPLEARIDRQADPVEIDPAGLARRLVRRRRFLAFSPRGANGAQPLALAHDQRRVIRSEDEAVGLVGERFGAQRGEVEDFQAAGRFLVPPAAVRTRDRKHGPHDLVRRAGNLAEATFGDRKCGGAPLDPVDINANRARPLVGLVARASVVGRLEALGFRIERRPLIVLQRDQIGTRRAREAQLELHAVVHRVERADRQEVQVLSLGVERRAIVAELGLRRQHALALCNVVQLDRAMPRIRPERIREPRAVRRPGEVLAASRVAAVDDRQLFRRDVALQHLVAMVGQRNPVAGGRGAQSLHAADVPRQRRRLAIAYHDDPLFA